MQRPDSHASMIFSPVPGAAVGVAAPPSAASSPRLLLAHLWKSYCKPLLLAMRCVSACATDRIRLLYHSFHSLSRQRATEEAALASSSGGGMGFGLLRVSAPVTPAGGFNPLSSADIVVYMQEYAHVRQQALLLLKQLLVGDVFAQSVTGCVVGFGASMAAAPPAPATHAHSLSQTHIAVATSWDLSQASSTAGWCSACFWQLVLDEVLFPLLKDLSSSAPSVAQALAQPLFLDSSPSMTACRTLGVTLLSKAFLRHLGELSAFSPPSGFTRGWLNVLKNMDRYMQMGVSMQRAQSGQLHQAQNAGTPGRPGAPGSGLSPHGVPLSLRPVPGLDWSPESGLQLTESVAEALTNVVLVMKAQGVFGATAAGQAHSQTQQPQSELWELTVAILQPWMPFIPALQSEIQPEVALPQSPPPQPQEAGTIATAPSAAAAQPDAVPPMLTPTSTPALAAAAVVEETAGAGASAASDGPGGIAPQETAAASSSHAEATVL